MTGFLFIWFLQYTSEEDWEVFAQVVLNAAYEATLAAANLLAIQREERVVVFLTSLGGIFF